jgi:type II secretory pathway pseudopilin PulG
MHSAGSDQRGGFTLVELTVSSALALAVITALMAGLFQQRRALNSQQLLNNVQQNARSAVAIVATDIANTGYGLNVDASELQQWVDWVAGFDANPKVTDRTGGAPDDLILAGAFDGKTAVLTNDVARGSNVLKVGPQDAFEFNTTDKKLLFLGKTELCRVTGIFGTHLSVSTHPVQDQGLKFNHAVGEKLELIQVRTYSLHTSTTDWPHRPYLTMEDSATVYAAEWYKMMVSDVETFQVRTNGNSIVVEVTSRSPKPDTAYTHPTEGDRYRRVNLSRQALPRNARFSM